MLMLCYPQHIAIYFAVTSFIVNVLCKCSNIARPRSGKPDGEQERRGAQKTGNRNKREYPASYSECSLFTSQPIEVRGKGLLSGWEKSFLSFTHKGKLADQSQIQYGADPKHLKQPPENYSDEKIIGQLRVAGYQFITTKITQDRK